MNVVYFPTTLSKVIFEIKLVNMPAQLAYTKVGPIPKM